MSYDESFYEVGGYEWGIGDTESWVTYIGLTNLVTMEDSIEYI